MVQKNKEKLKRYGVTYQRTRIRVPLDKNPRRGTCDGCGRSKSRGEIKVTQLHHWFYKYRLATVKKNPRLALDNTNEFCFNPCFPEKTYILGTNTVKWGEEVQVNEKIFNSSGNEGNVINKFERKYDGDIVCIKGMGLLPIKVTPEHEILISKRRRNKKSKIINGIRTTVRTFSFQEPQWIEAKNISYSYSDKNNSVSPFLIFPKLKIEEDTFWNGIKLTEDFARLLGLYLAEGYSYITPIKCGKQGSVNFAFGKHELNLARETKTLIEKCLQKHGSITEKKTALRVSFYSIEWASLFREAFGSGALNKKIPEFIMRSKANITKSFILGYLDGDGWRAKSHIDFITASKYIPLQLQKLLSKIDVFACIFVSKREGIKKIMGRQCYENDLFTIAVYGKQIEKFGLTWKYKELHEYYKETDNMFYVPIRKIWNEYYNGRVYNYETEDNTYQLSNIIVHNCHKAADALRVLTAEINPKNYDNVVSVAKHMPSWMQIRLIKLCKKLLKENGR